MGEEGGRILPSCLWLARWGNCKKKYRENYEWNDDSLEKNTCTNQPELVRNTSVIQSQSVGGRVAVAEAVLDEWQAVELVELPDIVVLRVSEIRWRWRSTEIFWKFGELICFNGGDMMAKRGKIGCHHGSIEVFRVAGKSNVPLHAQIGQIWRCRGIF